MVGILSFPFGILAYLQGLWLLVSGRVGYFTPSSHHGENSKLSFPPKSRLARRNSSKPQVSSAFCWRKTGKQRKTKIRRKDVIQGSSLCYQPKQCTIIREIPQNCDKFALFDSPQNGQFNDPLSSPPTVFEKGKLM